MTKSELIESVAKRNGNIPKKDIESVLNTVFDCMADAMARAERIEIRGFGSFSIKTHDAREGRNPKTGEKVSVPRKRTPRFAAGKELKERVDSGRSKRR